LEGSLSVEKGYNLFYSGGILLNIMAISVLSAPAVGEPVYDVETVADIMANTNVFELQAKSYVLMDAETGQILLENRSHERLPIASITKIMSCCW